MPHLGVDGFPNHLKYIQVLVIKIVPFQSILVKSNVKVQKYYADLLLVTF